MSENPQLFNEFSPTNRRIYQHMSLWQKIMVKVFSIFRKEIMPDYFTDIGLKQQEAEVAADPRGWYEAESKELTPAFAQDLHIFIKAMAAVVRILRDTTGSPNLRDRALTSKMPLLEHLICDLRGEGFKEKYPFGEREIFKLVNNAPIRDIGAIVAKEIASYFENFSMEEIQRIDGLYFRLGSIERALSVGNMDFLRRFNLNANFDDDFSWETLALPAAAYYLENFYQSVAEMECPLEDFEILPVLQKTRLIFAENPEPLDEGLLLSHWHSLVHYTALYGAENGPIVKLIQLARRNLEYTVEVPHHSYSIFDLFRSSLELRLKAVVENITRNSLKHEMKQLVQDVLPASIYSSDLTDVGVFTSANSDRIQAAINENLRNVYAASLLQVFIVKFYKPWVKGFLGSCAINAQFNQSEGRSQLNALYKNLNKLSASFDKFAVDVHVKSSMGVRITKLLDNPKLNRSDKHLLKVFTDSLNGQADILIKEFYRLFPGLSIFAARLSKDLENGTHEFISNVLSIKTLQDPEFLPKLKDFCVFTASVMDLLHITAESSPQAKPPAR